MDMWWYDVVCGVGGGFILYITYSANSSEQYTKVDKYKIIIKTIPQQKMSYLLF